MKKFAKLLETERGQVLVMRQDGDDGPEIAVYFTPASDLVGLCKVAVSGFGDGEDAEKNADAAFDAITDDQAIAMAYRQMDEVESMFREEES